MALSKKWKFVVWCVLLLVVFRLMLPIYRYSNKIQASLAVWVIPRAQQRDQVSRALKTRGNIPKYGLIFHSIFIGRAAG